MQIIFIKLGDFFKQTSKIFTKHKLFIHAARPILTIEERLQKKYGKEQAEQYLEVINQMYWPTNSENVPLGSSAQSLRGTSFRTLTYFAHKVPDSLSFPTALSRGLIYDLQGNRISIEDAKDPKQDPRSITPGIRFLPVIVCPYKRGGVY